MVNPPGFPDYHSMQNSTWLSNIKQQMEHDIWPAECKRCQDIESIDGNSVRQGALKRHSILSNLKSDYLILAGVLDNVCNSACQSCNPGLSTKIGSLYGKKYIKIDNQKLFDGVPWDRILEIDINGGEPTASPRYQQLLENLPPEIKVLRVNTNGSRVLPNLVKILDRGIHVIVTLSLDGTEKIHDYVRWPIKWDDYLKTLQTYQEVSQRYSNLKLEAWTVVHVLNLRDFPNIQNESQRLGIDHSWAFLERPWQLDVKFSNQMTRDAKQFLLRSENHSALLERVACDRDNQDELNEFISEQDRLRGISILDYL